ncbi:hypothetical protein [Nonomuraea sp. SBT364]|uniref:hypothetical protein n=1 Tax=Nonomuraea sp. SBT364 TaxID=1580530 RepID=UPI00066C177E|nr:hypothetical protein [Nonomuraea sp. SBT364]
MDGTLGRLIRLPSVFAILTLIAGLATGLAVFSRAGFLGIDRGHVVARAFEAYGIPVEGISAMARPGVLASAGELTFVDGTPSALQHLWQALTVLPTAVLTAGAFVLLCRLLWAARGGAYVFPVGRRLRGLGWWLLAGGLLAAAVEELAMIMLLDSVATQVDTAFRLRGVPVLVLLAGLGMLVLGNVLRDGARMREDLEGTV